MNCQVVVKTLAPAFLFREGLNPTPEIIPRGFDVGLVHTDNIHFDIKKTKTDLKGLLAKAEDLIQREQRFFSDREISAVVADIPFLPVAAAGRSGLPVMSVGNFTWDWIYAAYGEKDPEWIPLIEAIRGYYREGGGLLRLPFHGPMEVFERIEDIPLVARKSQRNRAELRRALDLPRDRRIGLVAFSRLDLTKKALMKISSLSGEFLFLIREPLDWTAAGFEKVEDRGISFIDLVNVSDFVITKPGYGIVSDCLAQNTPMIYCDRGEFPEYAVLVEGIRRFLPACYMPQEVLYSGDWRPYLDRFSQPSENCATLIYDGAQVAARRIKECIEKVGK
ncbi:MAG: hypothetical protein AB1585_15680 [Thermodesulfobacteriota bacterium]